MSLVVLLGTKHPLYESITRGGPGREKLRYVETDLRYGFVYPLD
jgi:hypothetical protein